MGFDKFSFADVKKTRADNSKSKNANILDSSDGRTLLLLQREWKIQCISAYLPGKVRVRMKRLVLDIDGTLTEAETSEYKDVAVNMEVLEKLRQYKADGFEIVLYTARNMRTHKSSLGKINAKTLPIIIDWLKKNKIPYDEIWVGKPWCGKNGFYVDDKAIRPDEFSQLSYLEICTLLGISPESE